MSFNRSFLLAPLRWLAAGLWFLLQVLLIAWTSFAIYYSNLPAAELRLALAVAFAAFAVWVLWVSRQRRMRGPRRAGSRRGRVVDRHPSVP